MSSHSNNLNFLGGKMHILPPQSFFFGGGQLPPLPPTSCVHGIVRHVASFFPHTATQRNAAQRIGVKERLLRVVQKLLTTMMPSDDEKTQIVEAQMSNPDVPLGPAETFLLTLGSISDLEQRLKLWAFTLEYDHIEAVCMFHSSH